MKNLKSEFALFASKLDKNTLQLILLLVSLGLLVVSAGAPITISGPGG